MSDHLSVREIQSCGCVSNDMRKPNAKQIMTVIAMCRHEGYTQVIDTIATNPRGWPTILIGQVQQQ